eukprot:CAMPEP_0170389668 /NCGR_PEP_ID=MMETSP0117_2-20130122/18739_1 /TAXON_ID=400756 /ORGANISM="Durinskia baltica, Strain CSIRO CS-38" /LENGTH=52 /DNA_ID=CAMNT_0010645669 /DNA_START=127 /DNA_END=286 /DNA_ORIENTATION=-
MTPPALRAAPRGEGGHCGHRDREDEEPVGHAAEEDRGADGRVPGLDLRASDI